MVDALVSGISGEIRASSSLVLGKKELKAARRKTAAFFQSSPTALAMSSVPVSSKMSFFKS